MVTHVYVYWTNLILIPYNSIYQQKNMSHLWHSVTLTLYFGTKFSIQTGILKETLHDFTPQTHGHLPFSFLHHLDCNLILKMSVFNVHFEFKKRNFRMFRTRSAILNFCTHRRVADWRKIKIKLFIGPIEMIHQNIQCNYYKQFILVLINLLLI